MGRSFVAYKRQFGEKGGHGASRSAFRRDDSTRIVILPALSKGEGRAAFARRTSLRFCICRFGYHRVIPSAPASKQGAGPLITNHYSQITAFLIDTLPIRIACKSPTS